MAYIPPVAFADAPPDVELIAADSGAAISGDSSCVFLSLLFFVVSVVASVVEEVSPSFAGRSYVVSVSTVPDEVSSADEIAVSPEEVSSYAKPAGV